MNTAKAEAELAYSLQAAKVQAKIKEEEMQVKVVERQQEIKIMEQEITRKERELDSAVKKPAEAEKFRLEKIAEADKIKKVLQAEADAEALALKVAETFLEKLDNCEGIPNYFRERLRHLQLRPKLRPRLSKCRRRLRPSRITKRPPCWT